MENDDNQFDENDNKFIMRKMQELQKVQGTTEKSLIDKVLDRELEEK